MNNTYHAQFFTATILKWKHLLKEDIYKNIIVNCLQFLVKAKRIKIYAFVIMPNHIHLLWHIQEGYIKENVQRDFLKFTAQKIKYHLIDTNSILLQQFEVNAKDRNYQFWKRNALSIDLYSEPVFIQKLNYIHHNPLQEKWRLSNLPEEYWYSSAKFYTTGVDDFDMLTHFRT